MQKGTPTSDRIGPYRVLKQLSVTGSVQTHLAREDGPSGFLRNVVLKIVPDASGEGAKDIEELARETTACAKLTHPSIVRTRHFFQHDDALVLVVEYIEGLSLSELLASRPIQGERVLSDEAALHVGVSICEALAHAHSMQDGAAPIIHRAVSPSNVLIARDGSVKLDGFGFAKILGGVGTATTGSSKWTPAYMAPEQVSDRPATPKVDVYSAGLILWELLAGRPSTILPNDPFAIEATLRAVARRNPESLATVRPDLPEELVAAVSAALVSAPEQRIISCAEVARRIRGAARFDRGKKELREQVIRAIAASSDKHQRAVGLAAPDPTETAAPASASRLPTLPPRAPVPPPEGPPPVQTSPSAGSIRRGWLPNVVPPPVLAPLHESESDPPIMAAPPSISSLDGAVVASGASRAPDSGNVLTSFAFFSSLVSRLQAPTHWRRSPWLVAWVGLALGLALLIVKLSSSGDPGPSKGAAPGASNAASPVAGPTPPPADVPSATEPLAASSASAAPSAEQPPLPEEVSNALIQRGLGYLTVHSSAPHANVYVNLKSYGRVEDRLTVPCGNRFVSIAVPANHPGEPLWLAPGTMVPIPCGSSFETTMNPRPLRAR